MAGRARVVVHLPASQEAATSQWRKTPRGGAEPRQLVVVWFTSYCSGASDSFEWLAGQGCSDLRTAHSRKHCRLPCCRSFLLPRQTGRVGGDAVTPHQVRPTLPVAVFYLYASEEGSQKERNGSLGEKSTSCLGCLLGGRKEGSATVAPSASASHEQSLRSRRLFRCFSNQLPPPGRPAIPQEGPFPQPHLSLSRPTLWARGSFRK